MRRIYLLFFFGIFRFLGEAQSLSLYVQVDSLQKELNTAKDDSTRWRLHHYLSYAYLNTKPDSALWYGQAGLQLAKKINYNEGEARSLNDIGNVLNLAGNYPRALEIYFEALRISEKINIPTITAATYGNIAELYYAQEDYHRSLSYHFKVAGIAEKNHLDEYRVINLLNTGLAYERINELDSALQYQQRAYELALRIHDKRNIGSILTYIGDIHSLMGNYRLAMPHYQESILKAEAIGDYRGFNEAYLGLARLFQRTAQTDSTVFYAKKALDAAQQSKYTKGILDAGTLISGIYEAEKINDSTVKYLRIAMAANDSMFNQQKVKATQNLTFQEQVRQQELELLKKQAAIERKNNLQYLGITVFIVSFFLLLFLISRRKTKPVVIEFAGLLALLLLFEFISLFIHPYIGDWTHHEPVFMLLILVAVASVLVPLHHKLSSWVKEKLAHKFARQVKRGKKKSTEKVEKIVKK